MGTLRLVPEVGEVFTDVRGEGRTLRVSWHDGPAVVVVSLWAGGLCRGSFRLPACDVSRLKALLGGIGDVTPACEPGSVDASEYGGTEPSDVTESINVIDTTESTGVIKDTSATASTEVAAPPAEFDAEH